MELWSSYLSPAPHLDFYFCPASVGTPYYTHDAFQEINKCNDKYKHPSLYHSIIINTIAISCQFLPLCHKILGVINTLYNLTTEDCDREITYLKTDWSRELSTPKQNKQEKYIINYQELLTFAIFSF